MKPFAASSILAGSMLLIPAPSTQADVRVGIRIGDYDRRHADTFRIGYDRGVNDGYQEGVKDGRRGDRFNFRDEGRYRSGAPGYRGNYGPRFEYANGYRRGFEAGYSRGYSAYAPRHDRRGRWDRDRYHRDRD